MEDLHLALASNDITNGWTPRHHILLFHSTGDTTVPYDNAERAVAQLGSWAVLHKADNKQDHIESGKDFFRGDSNAGVFFHDNLRISSAMRAIMGLPYKGQKSGDIKSW